MAAIRHVRIENFRGFSSFQTAFSTHAVLVGEPGAGRSDLIEALVRTLDPDSMRGRAATDLDLADTDPRRVATVEVVIGDLSGEARSALFNQLEFWDHEDESLIATLPAGVAPDPFVQEPAVRFGYRLAFEDGQPIEVVYYPKFADVANGVFPRAGRNERLLVPFLWQRGMSTKPLDLTGRGELRGLIDRQSGEDFGVAIDRFVEAVDSAAKTFSSQERVAAALDALLAPLRVVRRFDESAAGGDLIRLLPDGGAPSGLLRSLSSAITLTDSPPYFPSVRQGSTLLAALRGGALCAASKVADGAIVVIDDFGGEFDPFLARHLADELRRSAGQLIVATHSTAVASRFATDEIVRLHRANGTRTGSRIRRRQTRQDRISARYLTSTLIDAFNASAVVVVEGHHDRLGYGALAERAIACGRLKSLDAAGIVLVEAEGEGESRKVATAAKELGIFAVVVLDNDSGSNATTDPAVQNCLSAADVVIRLPSRMALEDLLLDGVPDAELVRVFQELSAAFSDLNLPARWDSQAGAPLRRILGHTLHNRSGSLHASFILELREIHLPMRGIQALERIREAVVLRSPGLIEL